MKLACIILAHRNPRQLAFLLAQLNHPAVRVYLHLDRRVRLGPFRRALAAGNFGRITMVSRCASRWGGIEVVDATLKGLAHAASDGCDYAVLLSGQDLALWSIDKILGFLEGAKGRSYMEHFPLPDSRYNGRLRIDFYTYTVFGRRETYIPAGVASGLNWKGRLLNLVLRGRSALKPPRRFPPYVRPYGGSQWWNLSRPAVDFVLGFLEQHPDYRAYHEHTLLPDELLIQSIVAGTAFARQYEVVNDSLRFMMWSAGSSHPKTLEAGDIPEMLASGKPFARKFDLEKDPAELEEFARSLGG